MDLSTLNQSLKEEESSSQRRSTHLRAAEDELNAFFRSSALGLTTLYRQGVAASKVSYEKGYAHALAHVLELWDKDRGWLKGYLQRRIEAIEASVDGEDEGEDLKDTVAVQQQQQQQQQQQTPQQSSSSSLPPPTPHQSTRSTDSHRQINKRSRSAFSNNHPSSSHHLGYHQEESPEQQRRFHRIPQASTAVAAAAAASSSSISSESSSRLYQSPSSSASSSFKFSTPLQYPPSSSTANTKAHSSTSMNSKLAPATRAADGGGGVIKTCSDRATLLRRLQKLKGLRAGGRGRVIDKIQSEIERPLKGKDDMVDEGEEEDVIISTLGDGNVVNDDGDAWTDEETHTHSENDDDDDNDDNDGGGGGRTMKSGCLTRIHGVNKRNVWSERTVFQHNQPSDCSDRNVEANEKVLERLDRRKRRRTKKVDAVNAHVDAEVLRGDQSCGSNVDWR